MNKLKTPLLPIIGLGLLTACGLWHPNGDLKDKPSYNNKKVVGVAKGVAPDKYVEPGSEGFWIMEYIKIRGCISKVSTTYAYEWEE